MLRKMLLVVAAVAMPVGVVAATAGTAGAAKIIDATGAPATASCFTSGGTLTFKVPIGLVTAGGYQAPLKNKGNQIKVAGVTLSCSSSVVSGGFTGTISGKIKTGNPSDTPAQEYSCAGLVGVSPAPGGTLAGTLKVHWASPAGQKFGGGSKSLITVTSIKGGTDSGGHGTFTIPGNPNTGSVSGSFPGSDAGASSTSTDATAETEAQIGSQCTAAGGVSMIALGTGTASLK